MKQDDRFTGNLAHDPQPLRDGVTVHASVKTSKAPRPLSTAQSAALNSLQVVRVDSSRLHRAFCDFPWKLYRNDPHWVAPLRWLERRRWTPRHNSSLRNRWTERFVVTRNKRTAGRVAVIIDPEFNQRWVANSGFFGFFECENDPEAAMLLLKTAEQTLQARGIKRILGPINLTTHDEVGLLISGQESRPMVLSPYQLPYYESLLLANNYSARCEYHAYSWSTAQAADQRTQRFLSRYADSASHPGIVLRASTPSRWKTETVILHNLYNACFSDVWGFVPIALDEFLERAHSFKPFYRPELVVFAYKGDQPIGFALALPDINEALGQINGRLFPLGWLRLMFAIRRIQSARFILLGVLPEHRSTGIALRLAHQVALAAQRLGIQNAELSLINENNEQVQRIVRAFGGQRIKTCRLFEKALSH